MIDLLQELVDCLRQVALALGFIIHAHRQGSHDIPAVIQYPDVIAVGVRLGIEPVVDEEIQQGGATRRIPIRVKPIVGKSDLSQGITFPFIGKVPGGHRLLSVRPDLFRIHAVSCQPPGAGHPRDLVSVVPGVRGDVGIGLADDRLRPCLDVARGRTEVLLLEPEEALARAAQTWMFGGERVEIVRGAGCGEVGPGHHQYGAGNNAECGIAGLFPADTPVIRARALLVQQLDIITLPRHECASRRHLRSIRRKITEGRGRRGVRDERLVRARRIRAEVKLHHFIPTHRKRITAADRRTNEPRDPRAEVILPILREALERRDELTRSRFVRVVRIRRHRADARARQPRPHLAHERTTVRNLRRRIQPQRRHHLPRLRSRSPLQLHLRASRILQELHTQIHLVRALQFDLPPHLPRALEKRALHDQLIIHPQPRPIIRCDKERIKLRELRLNLPRPGDAISRRRRDRRARRYGTRKVKVNGGIRSRRHCRGESQVVVILACQSGARLRPCADRGQPQSGEKREGGAN